MIPKAMADFIEKQPWLKLYDGLEDFVVAAVRDEMLKWIRHADTTE